MVKKVELVMDFETGETKTFYTPPNPKGSVTLDALDLGKELEKTEETEVNSDIFRRIAEFVAERIYNNRFTKEELIDGLGSSLLEKLPELLTHAMDNRDVESENFLREKNS